MSKIVFKLAAAFCLMMVSISGYAQQIKYPAVIHVALDGTGNYKTIQEAVNSVRDLGKEEVKIFIKKGVYHEKLVIPSWKTNISLIGENPDSTIITNADYSGKSYANGKDAFGLEKFSTYTSYTVLVLGNDFKAENLTIENTSGRVGQAVALHVEGDRVIIKNCHLLGNQDTLYAATEGSRQYYINCSLQGTTDFIFGEATAVFQSCTIKSLSNSYITAAATRPNQKFGFVFFDCKLLAAPGVDKVFLGRPWRPYAKTVFIRTEMGSHIVPEGWNAWKGDAMFPDKDRTAYYAEYGSTGAGVNTAKRVAWSKHLKKVANYTLTNIFNRGDLWNPENNK
ncbi:pectinesterase family protein [Pedobacter sp. MC2016-14]|uniref:pectinesterase family protein n=1 Tax=Pedobacter sp. MC2016-14 TaxID=2897327 RepID=UPI001E5A77B0|nr:pectinesterase family protein [Pedobacter sp. MC2016-14]MCD0488682.1 pectinesterase family protein [Pedobacter sp. MC2016-14]